MDRFGRYKVESELGRGGFGCVYKALDPTVGRTVALKVLVSNGDRDLLTRFRNEAAAAGKLRHPNIVTVYDFGEHQGIPYLVMEYLDGQDLEKLHLRGRKLTLFEKVSIMWQVADGLHHAHTNGIVHRDVKPGNIMLLSDGTVKIMDFGIARMVNAQSTRLTQHGNLIGTVSYMAPEQFEGGDVDALSDIFAYGTIYYELLTGVQPFSAPDPGTAIYRITSVEPAPIHSLTSDCPSGLEHVIERAMQKRRELRYHSLEDLQFDVEPIRSSLENEAAGSLVRSAEQALAAGDLDTAQRTIREAFDLDPKNARTRDVREKIKREVHVRAARGRSVAALATARAAYQAGEYAAAIATLESALRGDRGNPELLSALEDARKALARTERAAALLEQARRDLASSNLTNAYRSVVECLQATPESGEAVALLGTIRKEIERRERERRLNEGLVTVEAMVAQKAYEKAMEVLGDLEASYPTAERVRELLASVHFACEEQRRERQRSRDLDGARTLVDGARWSDAAEKLQELRRQFPADVEIASLLAYSRDQLAAERKAADVERIVRESRKAVDASEFDRAANLIEGGLRAWAGEPALVNMQTRVKKARLARERECSIQNAIDCIEEHLRSNRFGDALVQADAAMRAWDATELSELRARVQAQKEAFERQQGIERLVAEAEGHLASGGFAQAVESLRAAVLTYGGESRLRELLAKAETRAAASAVAGEAQILLDGGQLDQAIAVLEKGIVEQPEETHLTTLLAYANEAKSARRRTDEIAHTAREASALLRTGQLQKAAALIDAALGQHGHDEGLNSLLVKARAETDRQRRSEQEERARSDGTRAGELAPPRPEHVATLRSAPVTDTAWRLQRNVVLKYAAAAIGMGVLAIAGRYADTHRGPSPKRTLRVQTLPAGATISIADKRCAERTCRFDVPRGSYTVNAQLDGYEPLTLTGNISDRDEAIQLTMRPRPVVVRVSTNLDAGSVLLDGRGVGSLQAGDLTVNNVAPGKHVLELSAAGPVHSSVTFTAEPGGAPRITGSVVANNIRALAVASLGSHAEFVGTASREQVRVEGRTVDGVANDLRPGPHEVKAHDGVTYIVNTTPTPALTLFLNVSPTRRSVEVRRDEVARMNPNPAAQRATPSVSGTQAASRVSSQAPSAPPVAPAAPKAAEIRADEKAWEQLKSARDPRVLEAFRRDYPTSPLLEQAVRRLNQLEWEAARDASDIRVLQDFVQKQGPYTGEARKLLQQREWERVNRGDANALRAYVARHPDSSYRSEAEATLARLDQADRTTRDAATIRNVLDSYGRAFSAKDLNAVLSLWPTMPDQVRSALRTTFRQARSVSLQLHPQSVEVSGDSAIANCTRQIRQVVDRVLDRSDQVQITFRRHDNIWTIESIR